jgi:cytochrome c553
MQRYRAVLSVLSVALIFLVNAASGQQSSANTKATHPQIDAALQKCEDCHGSEAKQWNQSRHATGGAPCLVCHGAVNDNFIPKPALQRCQGCHAAIVESMMTTKTKSPKLNVCFTCHQPHTLKLKKTNIKRPHPNVGIGGIQ